MISHMWLENLAAYSVQIFVLILAGTALLHLFRLRVPAVLLAFWQLLMVLCLLLPVLQPWREVRQAFQGGGVVVPAMEVSSLSALPSMDAPPLATNPAPQRPISLPTRGTIALILGAGIGLRFLWLALGLLRLRRYRQRSRRLWVLPELIRDLQWRVGVAPEILLSRQIDSPVTFGWRRPAVLLPEAFTEMSESQQRPMACHELLHVERRDWPYILSEEILRSLLWFHPGVWWALSRIHLSREQVVDREVLRITGARGPYLESLFHIASLRGRPAAVPASLLLQERHLVQRVALMLKESTMSRFRVTVSLAAIGVCLLAAGILAAAWFPLSAPAMPQSQSALLITLAPPVPAPTTAMAAASSATPIPAMRQREPLRISPNHQATKLRKKIDPVYPEVARRAHVAQAVTLEVLVNEHGRVASTKVVHGHPLLNQAVIDAVKQWRYSPTYDFSGAAVPVITTVTIDLPPIHEYATGWVGKAAVAGLVGGVLPSAARPTPSVQQENPAQATEQREPLQLAAGIMESKLVKRVEPVYPEIARRARMEGVVRLQAIVNEQGEVSSVKVIGGGYPPLQPAAVEAVRQWRYSPTYLNGEPVPVSTTVNVTFRLAGEAAPVPPPPPADPGRRDPIRVGSAIQNSKLIHRVDPEYPEVARKARIEAIVLLDAIVNERGDVDSVRVIRGHLALDQAAIDAVKQWRYSPTLLNGEAVPVITTVSVPFALGGGTAFVTMAEQPRPAPAGQVSSREPLRVGGNVQESKLIHRVEPEYPELARRARIESTVILEVLVNEQGEVANVRVLRSHPLLEQAAVEAVKQWRYSPTFVNGVAVPVIATQTVVFRTGGGSSSEVRIVIDQDGSLKDLEGNPITHATLKNRRAVVQVPAGSQVPYAIINQTLRTLQEQGVQDLRLNATAYRYTGGRLFYSVRGPSNSPFPLPTIDSTGQIPDVQPAQLGIDLENLAATAKASGTTLGNPGTTTTLSYTVYVTETGQIVAVEGGLPQLGPIAAALRQAPVIAPGRRGNEPVPTAVSLYLSIRW